MRRSKACAMSTLSTADLVTFERLDQDQTRSASHGEDELARASDLLNNVLALVNSELPTLSSL